MLTGRIGQHGPVLRQGFKTVSEPENVSQELSRAPMSAR